jgi:hypothetical protein
MNKLKDIIKLFEILGFKRNLNMQVNTEFSYYLMITKQLSTPTYTDVRKVMYQTYWDRDKEDLTLVIYGDNLVTMRADGIDMILEVLKSEFPGKKSEIREWQIDKIIEE